MNAATKTTDAALLITSAIVMNLHGVNVTVTTTTVSLEGVDYEIETAGHSMEAEIYVGESGLGNYSQICLTNPKLAGLLQPAVVRHMTKHRAFVTVH